MGWGILIVTLISLFFGFAIVQEMFRQRHWRGLVNSGDRWAIKTLVEEEIGRWRNQRMPKGMNPLLWHGIQTAEVISVGREVITLMATTEAEYRVIAGRPQQVSPPLEEGMKVAAALIERMLYDVPNVRLALVRIDVYTTFRAEDGTPDQQCILSVTADRAVADRIPWEELTPAEIVGRFEGRSLVGANGAALAVDPGPPLSDSEDEGAGGEGGEPPPGMSLPPSRNGHGPLTPDHTTTD
ncbi:MAG TPA: hypothetical protein VKV26_15365 [Dehalococcoidia bacterium]|nr:hypothetical protein [Dehalococcoidia bacterium]